MIELKKKLEMRKKGIKFGKITVKRDLQNIIKKREEKIKAIIEYKRKIMEDIEFIIEKILEEINVDMLASNFNSLVSKTFRNIPINIESPIHITTTSRFNYNYQLKDFFSGKIKTLTDSKENKKNKNQKKEDNLHPMSKVDIRVGKVVNIEPNPEGEFLYNEEIDIGNGEIRKIASGLREHVDINDLKDSLVIVIVNLKKRNLKGWPSHGMILCATNKEKKVEPLRPPEGSQPGDLVYIGNLPREPATDKHCPWEAVCKNLFVNGNKEATYKDDKDEFIWHTDKGNIVSPNFNEATIS